MMDDNPKKRKGTSHKTGVNPVEFQAFEGKVKLAVGEISTARELSPYDFPTGKDCCLVMPKSNVPKSVCAT